MKLEHIKSWYSESERKFLRTPVGIFLLGSFLGELAPDPTDALHFWFQAHVFNNPNFPAGLKVLLEVFDWYFMSASYFLLLLILAYLLHINKVSTIRRITITTGILAIGVVIGLLARFVV